MVMLIDKSVLYEKVANFEEKARKRYLETPAYLPNGQINPTYIRYSAQMDERTALKHLIADTPEVDAVPVVHSSWEILNEHEEYVYGFKRVHDLAGVKTWAVVARCNKCGFVHYFIGGHMCYCYCPNCGADMRGDNG